LNAEHGRAPKLQLLGKYPKIASTPNSNSVMKIAPRIDRMPPTTIMAM
jgi:hypothetical protein